MSVLESSASGVRLRAMTTSKAADLWLGELERKGRSPKTTRTYRRLLDSLDDQLPGVDVDEITPTQLRRFLDAQSRNKRTGKRKAPGTIALDVTIVNEFFDWLTTEGVIGRNPTRRNGQRIIERPRRPKPHENDNIVSVSTAEVVRLLETADRSGRWDERICVHTLASLGPRRGALALARISDYDPDERTLRFLEKGGKTIRKPVPDRLADLIDAAIAAGVYHDEEYLVPNRGPRTRKGDRDDRVIWRIVTDVAARAGVRAHVHALRAAFAVYFLETNPEQVAALQTLLGHSSVDTTFVYLRRLNRRQSMEVVRDLDWDLSPVAKTDAAEFPQTAGIVLASSAVVGERGFEPLLDDKPRPERPGRQPDAAEPLDQALLERLPTRKPEAAARTSEATSTTEGTES